MSCSRRSGTPETPRVSSESGTPNTGCTAAVEVDDARAPAGELLGRSLRDGNGTTLEASLALLSERRGSTYETRDCLREGAVGGPLALAFA